MLAIVTGAQRTHGRPLRQLRCANNPLLPEPLQWASMARGCANAEAACLDATVAIADTMCAVVWLGERGQLHRFRLRQIRHSILHPVLCPLPVTCGLQAAGFNVHWCRL